MLWVAPGGAPGVAGGILLAPQVLPELAKVHHRVFLGRRQLQHFLHPLFRQLIRVPLRHLPLHMPHQSQSANLTVSMRAVLGADGLVAASHAAQLAPPTRPELASTGMGPGSRPSELRSFSWHRRGNTAAAPRRRSPKSGALRAQCPACAWREIVPHTTGGGEKAAAICKTAMARIVAGSQTAPPALRQRRGEAFA